ncbi:S-adenosyl-L-methionine-dependent methyltransferase [Ilyonectria destructans]|nr:S-adenosyl-L-methionine-dependent methyltransferase [Ilyonectria destructans]
MCQDENQAPLIVADEDTDSALGVRLEEESSLASLRSSILQHKHENGRRYHSMSEGKYNFPNDDQENERLDLQHQIWTIQFDGELALSPGASTAKRVLDIGTGTGLWAIDFAESHPAAEVIGVDLSPVQPHWVPPNCRFEIDDLEKEWTWSTPFDFILCRGMSGCFADVPALIQKAYNALEPGGYFEIADLSLPMGCDDGTITKDSQVWKYHEALYDASVKIGRPIGSIAKGIPTIEKAGFVDIVHREFKWPFSSWPRDPKLKAIGRYQCVNLDMGLEAFSLALLTRVAGWTKEEVLVCCAAVRREIRDRRLHGYWTMHVVYARKPE